MKLKTRFGTTIRWNGLKHILLKIIKENSLVIDVGAFDGFIMSKLRGKKEFTPFLIDLDEGGLSSAKSRGILVTQALGMKIPARENTFDVVLCLDVIEHVVEDEALVYETARVLKEGGILVLTTPKKNVKLTHQTDMKQYNEFAGHVRSGYDKQELEELLEGAGLKVIKYTSYHNLITRYLYYYFSWRNVFNLSMDKRAQILEKASRLQRWIPLGSREHVFISSKRSL